MRKNAHEIRVYAGGSSIVSRPAPCVSFGALLGLPASSCWIMSTGLRIVSMGCLGELDEPDVVTDSSGSTPRPNPRSGRVGEGGSENDVAPDWRLSEADPCVGEPVNASDSVVEPAMEYRTPGSSTDWVMDGVLEWEKDEDIVGDVT